MKLEDECTICSQNILVNTSQLFADPEVSNKWGFGWGRDKPFVTQNSRSTE